MNVNDMVAALAAKTVDAMINIEPYNAIAEAEGIGTSIVDLSNVDKMPVFMAATPDFLNKSGDTTIAYLKACLDVARDFKEQPAKVSGVIHEFFTSKGYKMAPETFSKALGRVDVNPGFPSDLNPYMQQQAEVLLREKRIAAIPDWKKVLRTEFMEKAKAGA
jgi:ABC-type nitrate/sulfonate/bicarbonate transport system substrate-binding protein